MIRASLGISASTSTAVKYRSATDALLDEDRVHFLGPVNAARQGELDVRRPARSGDEVDDGARRGRPAIAVPGLEEDAHLAQRFDERGAIEDGDVTGRQQRRRARAPGARHQDQGAGLGDGEIDAGEPEVGPGRDRPESLSLGRGGGLACRHLVDVQSPRLERRRQIGAERRGMPGHESARLALAGEAADDRGHLVERGDAIEDTADALELHAELFQGRGPPLGELPADGVGLDGRMLGARGDRGGGQVPRPAHLRTDAREELSLGGHSLPPRSAAPPSWKVRAATAGRSRVLVQSFRKNGSRLIVPSLTKGRCSTRPALAASRYSAGRVSTRASSVNATRSTHGAIFFSSTSRRSSMSIRGISMRTGHASAQAPQSEDAWARSLTERVPSSMAVRRMPIGPGYV